MAKIDEVQSIFLKMNLTKLKASLLGGETNGVFQGMTTLMLGTGAAKLIGIASMPIITRLYTPGDFGVLTIFISLSVILVPLVTLRYVQAIPLPRRDGMAINLLLLSACLLLCMSTLFTLVLWMYAERLLTLLSMQQLASYWWLIVLGLIGGSAYEILSLWGTRKRAYKAIAQTTALQGLLGNITKIALGLLTLKPIGLLVGQVVTVGAGTTNLSRQFSSDFKRNWQHVRLRRVGIVAGRYRHFPLYRLPSQFFLVFSMQAPAVFSAALYGAEATGQLGLALMALAIPVNMIGQAVGQAFYGEIAHLKKGSEVRIKQLAYNVQTRLFMAGIPAAIGIFFLSESVFTFVFGEQWMVAGAYASVLAPFVLLQLTSAPLIQILNVYNEQKVFLAINVLRVIGLSGIYWLCSLFTLEAARFVELLSVFLLIFYLLVSLYILHLVSAEAAKKLNL